MESTERKTSNYLELCEHIQTRVNTAGYSESVIQDLYNFQYKLDHFSTEIENKILKNLAENFEKDLGALFNTFTPPSEEQKDTIKVFLEKINNILVSQSKANQGSSISESSSHGEIVDKDNILIIEPDEIMRKALSFELENFEYSVKHLATISDLREAIDEHTVAIILNANIQENGDGYEIARKINEEKQGSIPIIFISRDDNLKERLSAAIAGGKAFFSDPLDIESILNKLDDFTYEKDPNPYKVLIVEDSATLAQFLQNTLKEANIITTFVTDPMKIMPQLIEFNPDLILMDVYMPGCSGPELAKVIRQMDSFVSIPIVYLSAEKDLDKQLEAMQEGGDDFLTKPIYPQHLISSVISRVRRYRDMRKLMDHDSLTGLLNHSKIEESIEHEVERAFRQSTSVAFAMIDLDNFKKVNDLHGHFTGDRVLKTLSRFLTRNLRKMDIVGRYGGEEFTVILPNTNGPQALHVMENLRNSFSKIQFSSEQGEFSLAFSCGIATFPEFKSSSELLRAADNALYHSKRTGKNRSTLKSEME
ncbi:MAG: diguanylate cyclase [Anaerolineaceae bacterium]|nr:diguanylate cyclase [Anaerolineaceae bacterium]